MILCFSEFRPYIQVEAMRDMPAAEEAEPHALRSHAVMMRPWPHKRKKDRWQSERHLSERSRQR